MDIFKSRSSNEYEYFEEESSFPLFVLGGLRMLPSNCRTSILLFLEVEVDIIGSVQVSYNVLIKNIYFKEFGGNIGLISPIFSRVDSIDTLPYIPLAHVEYLNLSDLPINDNFFAKFSGIGKKIVSLRIHNSKITSFGLVSILSHLSQLKRLSIGINFEVKGDFADQILDRIRNLEFVEICFEKFLKGSKIQPIIFSKPSRIRRIILRYVDLELEKKNQSPLNDTLEILEIYDSKINMLSIKPLLERMTNPVGLIIKRSIYRNSKTFFTNSFPSFTKVCITPLPSEKIKINTFFSQSSHVFLGGGNFVKTKFPFRNIQNYSLSLLKPEVNTEKLFKYIQRSRNLSELTLTKIKCPENLLGVKLSKYRFAHRLRKFVVDEMNWIEFDAKLPHCEILKITNSLLRNTNIREMLGMNNQIRVLDISNNETVKNKIIFFLNNLESLRELNIKNCGINEVGIVILLKRNLFVKKLISDCEVSMDLIKALEQNITLEYWKNDHISYDRTMNLQKCKGKIIKNLKTTIRKNKLDGILRKIKLK